MEDQKVEGTLDDVKFEGVMEELKCKVSSGFEGEFETDADWKVIKLTKGEDPIEFKRK